MRLPRVLRTTSFRLTLLYAGLFCASVLLLFGAMYWFGTGYISAQIDKTVSNEITEVRLTAASQGTEGLRNVVASYARHAPGQLSAGLSGLLDSGPVAHALFGR